MLRPPFFLFGSGRSGTSLLTRMLDAHPAIAVPYESHLYNRIYPMLPRDADLDSPPVRARLVRRILATDDLRHWSPRPTLEATLAAIRRPGFHGIVEGLLDSWTIGRGKARWGEKTPHHTLEWRLILEGFPHLKVLHLVRDGRDVAVSFRTAPFGPKHVYQAAQHWVRYLTAAEEAGAALGPDAFLTIRYEDLLEDPQRELGRICAFLGEDYDPTMLTFYRQGPVYPTDARNVDRLRQPVLGDNRDKWRTRLTRREQRIFEALAGPQLERYGYTRVVSRPRIARWEEVSSRYLEHPPRRVLAMLRNRKGYGFALETLRLKVALRRVG
ncbi:MAG TPA: sulfotransferase [Gemmatimonadales bacterium]